MCIFHVNTLISQTEVEEEKEIISTIEKIENAVYSGDVASVENLFSKEAFADIVHNYDALHLGSLGRQGILDIVESANISGYLIQQLSRLTSSGGYFNGVKYVKSSPQSFSVIFRNFGSNGVNYGEYFFRKIDGEIKLIDIFNFLSAEKMSETFRDVMESALAAESNQMTTEDYPINAQALFKLMEAKSLLNDGYRERAQKAFYDEITAEARNTKPFLLFELRLISDYNAPRYLEILDQLLKSDMDNKASIYLISIDPLLLRGEFDQCLEAIDSLQKITEDDFLDLLRGNINYKKGNIQEALAAFDRLILNFPYLPEAYDAKLAVLYNEGKLMECVDLLDQGLVPLNWDKIKLNDIIRESYPNLYQSSVYIDWLGQTDDIKNTMTTDLYDHFTGTWNLEGVYIWKSSTETQRIENTGEKYPDLQFNADYTYEKTSSEGILETGIWDITIPDGNILTYMYVDSSGVEGKDLIERGKATKYQDGNYYQENAISTLWLVRDNMVVKEGEFILKYQKTQSGSDRPYFEGRVLYQMLINPQDGSMSAAEAQDLLGDFQEVYFKGHKNKSISWGSLGYTSIYPGGDTLFSYSELTDTVYYELIKDQEPSENEALIEQNGDTLYTFPLHTFNVNDGDEHYKCQFLPEIKLDLASVSEMIIKSLGKSLYITHSVPLIFKNESPEVIIEGSLDSIIEMKLDDSIFDIPRYPRVKLEK